MEYEFKSLQALRGREGGAKAKWQNQGWEFVSENRGTLRTELYFRRAKPKTFSAYLLRSAAAFGRLQAKKQLAVVASAVLILVAGIVGIGGGTQSGGDTPNPSAAQAPAPSAEQAPAPSAAQAEPTITDISVDELTDKLDLGSRSGIKTGDRFRVIGELSGSEYWTTGASGAFFVTLKTTAGSDLIVFVDESAAAEWRDGTKVEMVLKTVEATIRGETTDGWLEAQSARTIG